MQSRFIEIGLATLAQSVEQRIRNAQVGRSSLLSGSEKSGSSGLFCLFPPRKDPRGILVLRLQVHFVEGKPCFHRFFMSIVPARGPQATLPLPLPVGPFGVPTGEKKASKYDRRSTEWTYRHTGCGLRACQWDDGHTQTFFCGLIAINQ